MSAQTDLETRRDAITAQLAAGQTTDGQSFGKMNLNIEGQEIKTSEYVMRLYDELTKITETLEKLYSSPAHNSGIPWEITSIEL